VDGDLILAIVVVTALAFDFTNGFHDTANAIATTVSTRAMSPRAAVLMAAVLNFVGAFISLQVAATVAGGIVDAGARAIDGGTLAAAIGPGIGPCCYEVGEEVAAPFRRALGLGLVRDGKLDLWSAAERALQAAGVEDIHRTDLCTCCNPELFFSHRRQGKPRGTQGVLALVA